MKLKIAENVKRLRRERDLTQEGLAEILGISGQTVSKWERGDGYPDIETLPLIANAFGVSVDDIIGMEDIRDERRIAEAQKYTNTLWRDGADWSKVTEEKYVILRDLAREFPNNYRVQNSFAHFLVREFVMHKDYKSEIITDTREERFRAALKISERVLESCTDTELRLNAESLRIFICNALGERERAVELANALPSALQSREFVLESLLKYDKPEDLKKLREYIGTVSSTFQMLINKLHGLEALDEEDTLALCLALEQLWRFAYRGDEQEYSNTLMNYNNTAEYLARFNAELALDYVDKAVDAALATPPEVEFYVGGADLAEPGKLEITTNNFTAKEFALWCLTRQVEEYESIREHPRFRAAVEKLS